MGTSIVLILCGLFLLGNSLPRRIRIKRRIKNIKEKKDERIKRDI